MKSMFTSINSAPTAAAASAGTTTSLIRSSNRATAAASAGGYPHVSDANRFVLCKEGRKPLVSMEYPYTLQGKNRRRFNPKWYKEYATLEYQSITDSINCFSCRMFGSSDELWTCKDWKHIGNKMKKHVNSVDHIAHVKSLASTLGNQNRMADALKEELK